MTEPSVVMICWAAGREAVLLVPALGQSST